MRSCFDCDRSGLRLVEVKVGSYLIYVCTDCKRKRKAHK